MDFESEDENEPDPPNKRSCAVQEEVNVPKHNDSPTNLSHLSYNDLSDVEVKKLKSLMISGGTILPWKETDTRDCQPTFLAGAKKNETENVRLDSYLQTSIIEPDWDSWMEVVCSQTPATDQKAFKLMSMDNDADFSLHHQEHDYAHHKHCLSLHQYCQPKVHCNVQSSGFFNVSGEEKKCTGSSHNRLVGISTGSETEHHLSDDYPHYHHHYNTNHHQRLPLSMYHSNSKSANVEDICSFACDDVCRTDRSVQEEDALAYEQESLTQCNPSTKNELHEAWYQLRMRVMNWLDGVDEVTAISPTDDAIDM